MTLHRHLFDVDSFMFHTPVQDGDQPVQVPAGWQIADGNQDDISVCGDYRWQSHCLVVSNGAAYGTLMVDHPHRSCTCMRVQLLLKSEIVGQSKLCLTPENREHVRQSSRLADMGCSRAENKVEKCRCAFAEACMTRRYRRYINLSAGGLT
jgi:hypothetical protein